MDNRPSGRGKKIIGKTDHVQKKEEGLGTGKPVGKDVSYSKRRGQGSQGSAQSSGQMNRAVTRGLGGGGILILLVVGYFLIKMLGGGAASSGSSGSSGSGSSSGLNLLSGFSSLMGGGSSGSSSGSSGLDLSSVFGGFSGGGSASTGWDRTANVGKLNNDVVSGSRSKYTKLKGNGKDTVTIMLYMCGTDLESKSGMATNDLKEIAAATISPNVNIIVHTGGCKQWKISGISNSVNQIYQLKYDESKKQNVMACLESDFGKDSMVKPSTLTSFIKYCTKNFPADRQMLIFWDHGGGSVSGYGYDEKNSSLGSMGLSGIDTALKNAGTKFDVVGFDACLMATLETGLMLNDYADFMLASEETEPGIGWYYTKWVTALSKNTSISTLDLGKQVIDDFVDECNRRCAGQKTTLSLVDLAELSATAPKSLKDFASSTSKLLSGSDYKQVSDARSATREFASSSKIDQVDLVNLCDKLGTKESKALAEALLSAVKYNKTSSSMSNAYGLSIYFPYQRTSYVKSAVSTYSAIGLGDEYSRCIQQFATLGAGGQASSGGGFDIGSLLGGSGSSTGSSGLDIGSLLGGLIGGRSLDLDLTTATETIEANQFDANLNWTDYEGYQVISLTPEQWSQVHSLKLNVFLNDGEGYINLGLDTQYTLSDDGRLVGEYDCTWVAIGISDDGSEENVKNVQPVMFNYESELLEGNLLTTTGTVPVLLNGELANLLVEFVDNVSTGETISAKVTGVRYDYGQPTGEDSTPNSEAKGTDLQDGDKIEFVCDYYTLDGEFQDSYVFGDPITYRLLNAGEQFDPNGDELSPENPNYVPKGNLIIGYTDMSDLKNDLVATYLLTDIYNNEYWTAPMKNVPLE